MSRNGEDTEMAEQVMSREETAREVTAPGRPHVEAPARTREAIFAVDDISVYYLSLIHI